MIRTVSAILGSALFLVFAPGVVAGLVPWWISRWDIQAPLFDFRPIRVLGVLLIVAGIPVLLESFARFALQGVDTPAPVFPTQYLVVRGFYRYVRNPMYLAVRFTQDAVTAGFLLFIAGGSMIAFTALANSTIQVETPDPLRGRVMSLYNLVYNGTTPPGALLIGWLIESAGLPAALGITGAVGLAGTMVIYAGLLRRQKKSTA